MLKRLVLGVTGFGLLLWFSALWALVSVPPLVGPVTDLTSTLSRQQSADLAAKLSAFEARKGSQIAVLIVPTTEPEDIAQFGIRVAETWKVGRQKIDDGVILIIAKDDRKLRLEVGYGLEGVISDVLAKRIIADVIKPFFKTGDFAAGIDAGVDQLIKLIDGESLPEPSQSSSDRPDENLFMLIVVASVVGGWLLSALFGRMIGGTFAAVGGGVLAWLLLGLGVAVIIALIIFFLVGIRQSGGGGWSNGGGFGGGSGGGSSWGGGGGGGFGGGGASDSW